MSDPAGELVLHLRVMDGQIQSLELVSSRAITATRVLLGRPVAVIPALVASLFSVCGRSQSVAAWLACRAAVGAPIPDATRRALSGVVLTEMTREHAMRLLLDWPKRLGAEPDLPLFQGLKLLLDSLEERLLPGRELDWHIPRASSAESAQVVDELQAMLALDLDPEPLLGVRWFRALRWLPARLLSEHIATLGDTPVETLSPLPVADWEAPLGGESAWDFIAAPTWQGNPREVGAMARLVRHPVLVAARAQYGRGVLTRLLARLLELQGLPEQLWECLSATSRVVDVCQPAPGVGLASVETARGLLVHRAVVAEEHIVDYRILAPTEWNFHPQGAIQGLMGLRAESVEQLRQRVRMVVTALDPCVEYRLVIDPDQGRGAFPLL